MGRQGGEALPQASRGGAASIFLRESQDSSQFSPGGSSAAFQTCPHFEEGAFGTKLPGGTSGDEAPQTLQGEPWACPEFALAITQPQMVQTCRFLKHPNRRCLTHPQQILGCRLVFSKTFLWKTLGVRAAGLKAGYTQARAQAGPRHAPPGGRQPEGPHPPTHDSRLGGKERYIIYVAPRLGVLTSQQQCHSQARLVIHSTNTVTHRETGSWAGGEDEEGPAASSSRHRYAAPQPRDHR